MSVFLRFCVSKCCYWCIESWGRVLMLTPLQAHPFTPCHCSLQESACLLSLQTQQIFTRSDSTRVVSASMWSGTDIASPKGLTALHNAFLEGGGFRLIYIMELLGSVPPALQETFQAFFPTKKAAWQILRCFVKLRNMGFASVSVWCNGNIRIVLALSGILYIQWGFFVLFFKWPLLRQGKNKSCECTKLH